MEMYVKVNVSTCIHRAKPVTSPTVWLPLHWLLAHCVLVTGVTPLISGHNLSVQPIFSSLMSAGNVKQGAAGAEARAHPFPIHPLAPGGKRRLLKP